MPRPLLQSIFPPSFPHLLAADRNLNPFSRSSFQRIRKPAPHKMEISVLGIGNVGKFVAHAMVKKPNRPLITLLLHRPGLANEFRAVGQSIEIITDGVSNKQTSFLTETLPNGSDELMLPPRFIPNIIVSTKTSHVISALKSVKHRLNHRSTVLFTQNGIGFIDEVNKLVFPQIDTRPNYLASIITHGLYSQSPFSTVHAGFGTISIGPVRSAQAAGISKERMNIARISDSQCLLEEIIKTPDLAAIGVSSDDLMLAQLEKLIINAAINPLTAIFNRKNGQLFNSPAITRLMQRLLFEASLVVRSLPELEGIPNITSRFSMLNLEGRVRTVAVNTATNTSSMLQDFNSGKETEIDYMNGYIVNRGTQLKMECPCNRRVIQLIKDRIFINEAQADQLFDA